MKLFNIVFLFCILLITGCSTTGGTFLGLLPIPKFTKGELNNSVYTAADNTFKISTPFEEGRPSYTYMAVKEQYYESGAYVSFTSSVSSNQIYRAEVQRPTSLINKNTPMEDVINLYLNKYKKQLTQYGGTPEELFRVSLNNKNTEGMLILLKQSLLSTNHYFIHIQKSKSGASAAVSVQWSRGCKLCSSENVNVLNENTRIKEFIESFELTI